MITPTPEQAAILAACDTPDNLSIVARAGCAKTTTLKMVAHRLPGTSLFLAFNKAIVNELAGDLPPACQAKTLNAIGHKMLMGFLGYGIHLDKNKIYDLPTPPNINRRRVRRAVQLSKSLGFCPFWPAKTLMQPEEFFAALDEPLRGTEKDAVLQMVKANLDAILTGRRIDFGDQLLAAILPTKAPVFDTVLVDEAQDLSALDHKLLDKLARHSRVIAVGDPLQAIYAFRGAHTDSMARLAEQFNTTEYKLTTSFRCAVAICEHVSDLAPDMVPRPGAPTGQILTHATWTPDSLTDAVLCRLNAPLFRLNNLLHLHGINAQYIGHDIIQRIEGILKNLAHRTARRTEVLAAVDTWERSQSRTAHDLADTMREVPGRTLWDMLVHVRRLRRAEGRLKLMTIHKAKGLEWDDCYILEPDLIGEGGQEPNLRYVARTRARKRLHYITLEGFVPRTHNPGNA